MDLTRRKSAALPPKPFMKPALEIHSNVKCDFEYSEPMNNE